MILVLYRGGYCPKDRRQAKVSSNFRVLQAAPYGRAYRLLSARELQRRLSAARFNFPA